MFKMADNNRSGGVGGGGGGVERHIKCLSLMSSLVVALYNIEIGGLKVFFFSRLNTIQ